MWGLHILLFKSYRLCMHRNATFRRCYLPFLCFLLSQSTAQSETAGKTLCPPGVHLVSACGRVRSSCAVLGSTVLMLRGMCYAPEGGYTCL